MSDLKKQREERHKKEMDELPIMLQALVNRRSYFEYADYSQYILEQQIMGDILILQSRITEWTLKLKKEDVRYKELYELSLATLRIDSYFKNIQTTCKAATVQVVEKDQEIKRLHSRIKTLEIEQISLKSKYENQIKSLSEQINFLEK